MSPAWNAAMAQYGAPNPLPVCPPGSQVCARVVTRTETDRAGRVTQTISIPSATGWKSQTTCIANCGAGTGFFGLGGTAADIARTVGSVIAAAAPALTGYGAVYSAASTLANQVERSQNNMGFNLSGVLGAVGGILGNSNLGDYSALANIGSAGFNIASAALAPTPSYAAPVYGPIYGPPAPAPMPQAQPVMSGTSGVFVAAGSAIAARVAPILTKIAVKLGMRARPSLTRAMDLVRRTAKILQSPEAVAVALGITTAELASLIVSNNQRKRRRMNPANAHALRRAARRIKSFHKLCTHTDLIRTHRRSSSRGGCFKCGKRKCSC